VVYESDVDTKLKAFSEGGCSRVQGQVKAESTREDITGPELEGVCCDCEADRRSDHQALHMTESSCTEGGKDHIFSHALQGLRAHATLTP